jgi:MFS family permease
LSPSVAAPGAATVVLAAGVCAALHVGKLAPAIAALQVGLGLTLLQAGFLLSGVQAAGMAAGLLLGLAADTLGGRRSVVSGLLLLALASAAGATASAPAPLLALRLIEGVGFLLVALPAPGLLRRLTPPQRVAAVMGVWGAYMPLGTALALLIGPLAVALFGWPAWWLGLALLSALMAAVVLWRVPPAAAVAPAAPAARRWGAAVLRETLASPGPWLVALAFAVYSGQWLAVIGFLPTIYASAGVAAGLTGVLTALAAAANIGGNVAAGRLLQRGVPAPRLLMAGYAVMALATLTAFAAGAALPPVLRYAAVLVFSGVGGLVPGTLFALALRVAPGEHAVATTVGWMQQWSSAGQFAGPPLVAALAVRAGGWQFTWVFSALCSAAGVALALALARRLKRAG